VYLCGVKALLRQLIAGAETLLLFTQSVLSISVHHLASWSSSPAADMTELFRVTKKPVRIVRELNPVVVHVDDVYKSLGTQLPDSGPLSVYHRVINTLPSVL